MLRGTLAAAVTPLQAGGVAVDGDAIRPYCDFLVAGGLDGILVLGTTGEGILLSYPERRRVAELYVHAAAGRLKVAVHCGALTTEGTERLAAHASSVGADAVAVIAPPYYGLDERALYEHFRWAARACNPLPFYVYEFAARSGYAVPPSVLDALRERASNFAGLKVSDTPWERFEPYLIEGLDILVGPEAFIARGLEAGAVGAVSGLAAAFPERVAEVVGEPTPEGAARLEAMRKKLDQFPFHAALKRVLRRRGVPVKEDVRAPLRSLTESEQTDLDRWLDESS